MPRTRDPAPTVPPFARRLAIETPEHLVLELELAGLGSRLAAAACDALVLTVLFVLVLALLAWAGLTARSFGAWYAGIVLLVGFVLPWGYFLLFEALNTDRTTGKRYEGIRVVMAQGHAGPVAAGRQR